MATVKPQRKKAKQAAPEALLFAAEFDLFSDSEVPASFEILPPSGFTGRDGRGPFTYEFDTLQEAFVANAQDLPIDRDHKILLSTQLPDPTAGEALGWIKQIAKNERGGVDALVEWTEEGAELIASKKYRYCSPVFLAPEGVISCLVNVALTNLPNLKLRAIANSQINLLGDENAMTLKQKIEEKLGKEFNSDDELLAEIDSIVNSATATLEANSAYVKRADVEAMSTQLLAATGQVNALTAELNSLKQAAADKHIADEVEALIANSCLLPAQREAAVAIAKTSGLDALKSLAVANSTVAALGTSVAAPAVEADAVLRARAKEMAANSIHTEEAIFNTLKQLQATKSA